MLPARSKATDAVASIVTPAGSVNGAGRDHVVERRRLLRREQRRIRRPLRRNRDANQRREQHDQAADVHRSSNLTVLQSCSS